MRIVKYVVGSLFILGGLGSIVKMEFIAGFSMCVLGLILLPIVSDNIYSQLAFWKNKYLRYVTYIILILAAGASMKGKPVIARHKDEPTITAIAEKEPQTDTEKEDSINFDRSKFWSEFDPMVKTRIYKKIKLKDCYGLQEEFNIAADMMDKLQATGKSGSRNLDLMNYLEGKMQDMDCH